MSKYIDPFHVVTYYIKRVQDFLDMISTVLLYLMSKKSGPISCSDLLYINLV